MRQQKSSVLMRAMLRKTLALLVLWAPLAQATTSANASATFLQWMKSEWQLGRDRHIEKPQIEEKQTPERDILTVTFRDHKLGQFRMLIDGPRGFRWTERIRPVVFMTAGFFSGTKPASLMNHEQDLVVAVFEYSPQPELSFLDPQKLGKTLVEVPGRLYLALRWLERQGWVSSRHLHVMGVSLGSLYLPAAMALLQQDGFQASSTIFAFGGGDVREPLKNGLRMSLGEFETELGLALLTPLITPLDPSLYLPLIKGRKLVIHGTKDTLFTAGTRKRLNQALPAPKMICDIDGVHIDLGRTDEIALTLGILRPWITGKTWPHISQKRTRCRTITGH